MKSIEDVIMEHAKQVRGTSSTGDGKRLLELPDKWEFNTAGNIYLSALRVINKLMKKIEELEK